MARPSNTTERRRQIAGALERVMAKRGYDGASTALVARTAGLAPGLVHYHFGSKLEILLELLERLVAEHHEALERALDHAGEDPLAQVGAFIDAHLALGPSARPDALACWVTISGEALRVPRVRRAYEKAVASLVDRLAGIVRAGVAAGVFRCDDAQGAACAIVAAIEGYYVLGATARSVVPHGSAAPSVRGMAAGLLAPQRPIPAKRGRA